MYKVLLVEDDPAICDMLQLFLTSKSYHLSTANCGKKALQHLEQSDTDVLLLDWMLPDIQGPKIVSIIRNTIKVSSLPIIMLTAKGEERDKIQGLHVGADDYLTKPVSLQELNARIEALLRRSKKLDQQLNIFRYPILLSPKNQTVTIHGKAINLGSMEYRLLYFLMKNPNRLYTRSQLLDQVWGLTTYIDERTVDVNVMRLRKVLKSHGTNAMLKTVRGGGYIFESDDHG